MAEVSFNSVGLLSFVLYLQFELYYSLCYNNVIFLTKVLKLRRSAQITPTVTPSQSNSIYFIVFILSLFFVKNNLILLTGLLTFIVVYLFCVSRSIDRFSTNNSRNNTIYFILPTFVTFFYMLFLIKSFLTLFFFIELYSVLYYFCFLSSYSFTNQSILKYKNGLLFLLWNNFLTTFFLTLGCLYMLKQFGTTSFFELSVISGELYPVYLFAIGLFWKLGLPLFHFFKLEIYKYLLRENVFLFSIITTIINTMLLILFVSQPIVFNTIYLNNYLIIILVFSIVLAVVNLNLTNVLHFFAFSGVFTLATVLTVLLI